MAMMDCPRCGFSQPKDRYCANCGLDNETYEARPTPPLKKLSRSPYLYIVSALFVLGYIGYEISRDDRQSLSSFQVEPPITELEKNQPSAGVSNNDQQPAVDSELEQEPITKELSPPAKPQPAATQLQEVSESQSTRSRQPEVNEELNEPIRAFSQLEILFFEVPSSILPELSEPAEALAETAEYRTFLHLDKAALLQLLQMGQRLSGSKMMKVAANQRLLAQFTSPQSAASIFSIEATIVRLSESRVDLSIRTLLNLTEAETRLRFSTNTYLNAESAVVFVGLLPHLEASPYPQDFWEGSPVDLVSNPDFQDRLSELVVLISLR